MKLKPKGKKGCPFAEPCWKVTPARNLSAFLRALPDIVPDGSVLYIETGGAPPEDVRTFLDARQVDDDTTISGGTLLPKPRIYRIAITKETVEGFATIAEKHPTPIGAVHLHVYRDNTVFVLSYDAFLDPFWISKRIPEEKVKAFCQVLGIDYAETESERT
jgi:hypothetical protein